MAQKRKWKPKLAQKISLLVIVLIILAVGVSVSISGNWYLGQMLAAIEENTLNVVKITAMSPIVVGELERGENAGGTQRFVERTQAALDGIDVIVVADSNGIRYGHTKSDRVGKPFSAEDHQRAIEDGETYAATGPGTLGDSLRAFTPVRGSDGEILGFVMAGTLLDSIARARQSILWMTFLFIILGCAVGIGGALFLSRYVKKSLLNYEPEDIARLYLENRGILATVHEGVIAINQEGAITLMNETAQTYLSLEDECVGKALEEVFPLSKLPQVLTDRESLLNVPYALGERLVVSNNVPIINDKGELVGGVCSFRDQTEMNQLAEEMTGVKKIVDALRASTHEFKNKLHVILGLVECGKLEKAKRYIGSVNEEIQSTISNILGSIHEPTIAALCIGKSQRGHELRVALELSEETGFTNALRFDVNALVVILGNLLDNAMEALDACEGTDKRVELLLNDEGEALRIVVRDNGPGLPDDQKVFQKGYTTKQGSRGYGLFLVREQVEKYGGTIDARSLREGGTEFEIIMHRGKSQ